MPPPTTSELVYVPFNASWLNRIEGTVHRAALLRAGGTDHASHKEQGRAIRRYVSWRNRNPHDRRLRKIVDRANIA